MIDQLLRWNNDRRPAKETWLVPIVGLACMLVLLLF